jgi:protein-S-isoprenylcysteine O-methyltransferase Ste14
VIIQFLLAGACLLIVLSLPVMKTALGAALRRWGCFLFLLALAPSVLFGLLHQTMRSRMPWSVGGILEGVFTIVLVAAIAYALLAWRKRAAAEKKPSKRIAMKQPVDPPGARPDLVSMLRDQLRDGSGGEPEHGE